MSGAKIMFIGFLFVIGWVLGYLFVRQIVFNANAARPIIKNMKNAKDDLIVYDNAIKYTSVSTATCIFMILLFSAIVIVIYKLWARFDLYLTLAFFGGFVVSALMLVGQQKPDTKLVFESFCKAYYRFVPDDQLRTEMYNCKVPGMKLRCHDMGVSTDWIPTFKKEK